MFENMFSLRLSVLRVNNVSQEEEFKVRRDRS